MRPLVKRYKVICSVRRTKVNRLKRLKSEYKEQKNSLFKYIQKACEATKRLEESSLSQSALTSVAYIERLIEFERDSKRPNKQYRIEQLQRFKGRAEALSMARDGIAAEKDQYEEYVMKAIEKAMEEMTNEEDSLIIKAMEQGLDTLGPSESSSEDYGVDPVRYPYGVGSRTRTADTIFSKQRQNIAFKGLSSERTAAQPLQHPSMPTLPLIATNAPSSAVPLQQNKDDVSMLMNVMPM